MLRRIAISAASLGAVGCVLVLVASLLPWFPFTLLEHFRVQYVVIGALVVAGTAALRLRGYFDAAAIVTLVQLLVIAPDLTATGNTRDGAPLRVLFLNVHTESTSFADVRALIADTNADIVALVETNKRWLAELAPALTGYPGRIEAPSNDNFGLALYARVPVTGELREPGGGYPTIVAQVGALHVIVTHPMPPIASYALQLQRDQLDGVGVLARGLPAPVLVVGDLNATPWSRSFRRLITASGLCDTRAGFGVQASFPSYSVVARIPIDHALVSCDVGVADRRIGPDVGSDHLPVILDLRL